MDPRTLIACADCSATPDSSVFDSCCPACGGRWDFSGAPSYAADPPAISPQGGLARFRATFPLPPEARLVTLGEGNTPLLSIEIKGRTVYLKCEHQNPSGSFKDRGTAVLVSAMLAAGVDEAVEDSSGNAGASFAAYAGRAGIRGRVFVPEYASGPKRRQIAAYGAEVVEVPGPRLAATQAALEAVAGGVAYASHALLPHGQAGIATAAYEIVEQLGEPPGALVIPVGQGTLLLGMQLGLAALTAAGKLPTQPMLVGVQAQACAPLCGSGAITEAETVAEGIRISQPLRREAILQAVERSGGRMIAIDEPAILRGRKALAASGVYVEPTSAVIWPALLELLDQLPDPVVALLTGMGLKSRH